MDQVFVMAKESIERQEKLALKVEYLEKTVE